MVFGPKFSFRARNLTNELVRYSNFVQDMLSALHLIMIDKLSLPFVTVLLLSRQNEVPRYETLPPGFDKITEELKIFAFKY